MRYAAYGSNLHPHRLRKRVPSATLVAAVTIPGWSLEFHKHSSDGSGKCNIVRADQSVLFAVFDIDASEKSKLDAAEGLNFGYEEKTIEIDGFGLCFCYVASESHIQENLQPYSWYKELVIVGLEHHRASPEYLERVRSTDHTTDNDRERHNDNMAIVAEARDGT